MAIDKLELLNIFDLYSEEHNIKPYNVAQRFECIIQIYFYASSY